MTAPPARARALRAYNLAGDARQHPRRPSRRPARQRARARARGRLLPSAYVGFAVSRLNLAWLALLFVAAGVGIGLVETAEHAAVAALAPNEIRGSAFGLLAAIQSFGNFAASAIAGVLWTLASPRIAFLYLAAWMLVSLVAFGLARRPLARSGA